MGQYLRVSQNNNKQTNNTLIEMKHILVLCLSILSIVSCAPQYSDQTGDLGDNLEIVSDIFGDVSGITHSGVQPGNVADVEVAVEVLWCVPASTIPIHMYRLEWWPGGLDVERTIYLGCMHQYQKLYAG